MKILIVTYKADISGGSNRSLLSIIDMLLEDENEVILLLPKKAGDLYNEAKKRNIMCWYMPYSRIGVKRSQNSLVVFQQRCVMNLKLFWDKLYTIFHIKQFRDFNFDIVYTNGSAIHAGRLISQELNVPHVWHIREFFDDTQLLPKKIYQIMEKGTDKFILISNDMYYEYAKHIAREKLEMISNGIHYIEQPEKEVHEGINILLVGRITEAKCQIDALQAMKNLCKDHGKCGIHLFFAGKTVTNADAEYEKNLKLYIKENCLAGYITFLGEVNNLSEIRRKMDIELMCSSREPFGRVTVEAMRSGLAVIGANSGGTKDIIIDGYNGLFYDPGNIEDLTQKIDFVIENPAVLNKLALQARMFSRNNFTEKQLEKTIQLLHRLGDVK